MDTKKIGSFIAEMRKQKGLTQNELAEKLSVTYKAVSRWETGRGLPDTSLLKPLSEVLGISVSELLSGQIILEENVKGQTDKLLPDSLQYSGRMLPKAAGIVLFLAGAALLASPLYTAVRGGLYWLKFQAAGIACITAALICICLHRKSKPAKISPQKLYLAGMLLEATALILELLPVSTVMLFAADPSIRQDPIRSYFSYFDTMHWGYADFAPPLTGCLTVAAVLLGAFSLFRFEKTKKCRDIVFVLCILSIVLSVLPLFFWGTRQITVTGCIIFAAIFASACLQAMANSRAATPQPPEMP